MAVLAAGFGAGCKGGKVTCSARSSAGETVSWRDFSDGKERQVKCEPPKGKGDKMRYACTCVEGGVVGKSFEMVDVATLRSLARPTPDKKIEASYDVINKQCGWAIGPK